MTRPTLQALCCACGTVRLTTDFGARPDDTRPEKWAQWRAQGLTSLTPTRYTVSRKCATCQMNTRHALIRDDEDRNEAEVADRLCALPAQLEVWEIFNEFRAMGNVKIKELDGEDYEHLGVGVRRNLYEDSWEVRIYGVLPIDELVWRLRKIQERMRDTGAKWWLTCEDGLNKPCAQAMWRYDPEDAT